MATSDTLVPLLDGTDHVLGPDGAPLELVMFGDFECPYCIGAQSIVARVRSRLEGRLLFVYRHLPITQRHPHAQQAAEASEAAAAQGRFWEMHDALYASRGKLALDDLVRVAGSLGVDADRLRTEVTGGVHAERVDRDVRSAEASGVRGTPSFFVNGVAHPDAFDAGSLVEALEGRSAA